MKLTRALVVALSLVGAIIASPVTTGEASAAPTSFTDFPSGIKGPATLYDCISTVAFCMTPVSTATAANRVHMICWEDGRTTDGQVRWFYVRLDYGGEGYISAPMVTKQVKVQNCRNPHSVSGWSDTFREGYYPIPWYEVYGVLAARSAIGRRGQAFISGADQAVLNNIGYADHYGNWSADCIGFVALAWHLATGGAIALPGGNAGTVQTTLKAGGAWPPPRGALTFVRVSDPRGHVMFSLGNGRFVTTTGSKDIYSPASAAPANRVGTLEELGYGGKYVGWSWPTNTV
ncbi:MAG: hypothetical protein AB7L13_24970 [Acidimicrobiia bacterium]